MKKAEIEARLNVLSGLSMWGDLTTEENNEGLVLDKQYAEILLAEANERDSKRQERGRRARNVNKRAKRDEQVVCEMLGLKWLGVKRRGVSCADGQDDCRSIDITTTKRFSEFYDSEMVDAKSHAGHRTPVVIIRKPGQRLLNAHVVMYLSDYADWYGGGEQEFKDKIKELEGCNE